MTEKNLAEAIHCNLARNLKQLRLLKGMTQADIAELLHISVRSYRDIELGRSFPDIVTLCGLADFYGVDLGCLIMINIEEQYHKLIGNMGPS